MASHPKQAMNGNGHPGGGVLARLRFLLDHHTSAAKAIQTTLGLLNQEATKKKKQDAMPVLAQALQIEAHRRAKRPVSTRAVARAEKKYNKAAAIAKRKATATFLNKFSDRPRELPRGENPHRIGVLVQHGYLKTTTDGLVRTDKPFTA